VAVILSKRIPDEDKINIFALVTLFDYLALTIKYVNPNVPGT
jgi:hypothetical protein